MYHFDRAKIQKGISTFPKSGGNLVRGCLGLDSGVLGGFSKSLDLAGG